MEELWDDYLQYLVWLCHLENKGRQYSKLFEFLHNIEFIWSIERDENRAGDGMELRDNFEIPGDYLNENQLIEDFMNRPCSVLEMLIALSIRVDDDFIGDPAEPHPEEFFWEMIDNLGLCDFTDKNFNISSVDKRIKMWLERRFTKYGLGSPFPVLDDRRDQRELEIWDQMNSYINEKYG